MGKANKEDEQICLRKFYNRLSPCPQPLLQQAENLIRLGVPRGQAYVWSRTRKGDWAVAQSPILITTVTVKGLARRGYESMLHYYKKVAS